MGSSDVIIIAASAVAILWATFQFLLIKRIPFKISW
jgi:hypothetical protein